MDGLKLKSQNILNIQDIMESETIKLTSFVNNPSKFHYDWIYFHNGKYCFEKHHENTLPNLLIDMNIVSVNNTSNINNTSITDNINIVINLSQGGNEKRSDYIRKWKDFVNETENGEISTIHFGWYDTKIVHETKTLLFSTLSKSSNEIKITIPLGEWLGIFKNYILLCEEYKSNKN